MSPGPWQIIIIVVLILLFFGRGRISDMMGDLGKGIKSFKSAVSEDDANSPAPPNASPTAQGRIEVQPPRDLSTPPPPPEQKPTVTPVPPETNGGPQG